MSRPPFDYSTFTFSTIAVKDVSLNITKDSFTGIMGASGSGKTTPLNMIANIDRTFSGQAEIDGQNIAGLSEKDSAAFRPSYTFPITMPQYPERPGIVIFPSRREMKIRP